MHKMNSVFVALIPLAMGTATGALAETESLTCRPGVSITAALAKLKPGDVLQVRGVCRENAVIPAHLSNLTLQGINGAVVEALDTAQPVIAIRGREIKVSGLTLTGSGVDGVLLRDGAFAFLDGNTMRANAGNGIQVLANSTARIWNNVIENNGGGILVTNSSSALIGVTSGADLVASPNTIRNNSGNGVAVSGSSSGRVIGNTITGNLGGSGVIVLRGAQADVAGNNISANAGDGIRVVQNSTVLLAPVGAGIYATPNSTDDVFPNTGYGVSCDGGSYIRGRLGTLMGSIGASLIGVCTEALLP